jgi:hypothetical protein
MGPFCTSSKFREIGAGGKRHPSRASDHDHDHALTVCQCAGSLPHRALRVRPRTRTAYRFGLLDRCGILLLKSPGPTRPRERRLASLVCALAVLGTTQVSAAQASLFDLYPAGYRYQPSMKKHSAAFAGAAKAPSAALPSPFADVYLAPIRSVFGVLHK